MKFVLFFKRRSSLVWGYELYGTISGMPEWSTGLWKIEGILVSSAKMVFTVQCFMRIVLQGFRTSTHGLALPVAPA